MGGRRWSGRELDFLAANSGKMTTAKLSRKLGRTEASVSQMAYKLRESGKIGTTLRTFESSAMECPQCHEMRKSFTGAKCSVCHQKEHVDRFRDDMNGMIRMLPHDKIEYATTSINSEPPTGRPRRPKESDYERVVFDSYAYERDVDRYISLEEEWELANIKREWDALRRKKKRWNDWINGKK